MAEYAKFDGVAAADIVKIDGVTRSDISKVCGTTTPAQGATVWVCGMSAGKIAHASPSDLTDWTDYDNTPTTATMGAWDIAAGKDASGNTIFVMSRDSVTQELQRSGTDVTVAGDWTAIDLGSEGDLDQYRIIWCDDGSTSGVWLCVGRQTADKVYRSTDGAVTWSGVDISGLTGHISGSGNGIQALTCGNGITMMAQGANIYYSTNYGSSWTSIQPFTGNNPPGTARCLTYTNNSFALIYGRSGIIRARSCADTDVTDWSNEVTVDDGPIRNPTGTLGDKISVASAGGRVVHVTDNDNDIGYFDVDGKTISNVNDVNLTHVGMQSGRRPEDIETDGNGIWLLACRSGDIWRSNNNGQSGSWTRVVANLDGSNTNIVCIASDALYPF